MRVGILGGTFDPVHLGHLRLAEEAGDALHLEKVYLVPAASPPHKERKSVAPFHHRLAMTQLGAKESPLLEAMDLEGRRGGLSYSIETLREFHRTFGPGLELFFILGVDAFLEIRTWKEHERLFDYARFVVVSRPGFPAQAVEPFLSGLGAGPEKRGAGEIPAVSSGNGLISMEATLMDISSSRIREKVACGESIRFLVPESVREYIIEKGLYKVHGES